MIDFCLYYGVNGLRNWGLRHGSPYVYVVLTDVEVVLLLMEVEAVDIAPKSLSCRSTQQKLIESLTQEEVIDLSTSGLQNQ